MTTVAPIRTSRETPCIRTYIHTSVYMWHVDSQSQKTNVLVLIYPPLLLLLLLLLLICLSVRQYLLHNWYYRYDFVGVIAVVVVVAVYAAAVCCFIAATSDIPMDQPNHHANCLQYDYWSCAHTHTHTYVRSYIGVCKGS